MINLPNLALSHTAQNQLDSWQNNIDSIGDYASRVEEGKKSFAR